MAGHAEDSRGAEKSVVVKEMTTLLDSLVSMASIKALKHSKISLKIPLDVCLLATENFSNKHFIGKGGFGHVYRGDIPLCNISFKVAIKVLIPEYGQGDLEFGKEIRALTSYRHENIVFLLGYCDEKRKKIIVYEYVHHCSLDRHLSSTNLSWKQRLRICIGAAHGIKYLHDNDVLHRDIKSANILLDENWNAKISDFGLFTHAPPSHQTTFLSSEIAGTRGYCDPYYAQTGYLSKQSDVYSFGVVLFEVLCGRLCVLDSRDIGTYSMTLVQTRYKEKKLDTIILDCLKEQISPECLQWFSKVAYQCLCKDPTERPSMTKLARQLELALKYQEEFEFEKETKLKGIGELDSDSDAYWETKLPTDLELIINMLEIPPAIYTMKKELFSFLHKGILFDEESKFFWINDDGKICLSTSLTRFVDINQHKFLKLSQNDSRFPMVAQSLSQEFNHIKCHIDASMLSVGTMYEANLVFRHHEQPIADLRRLQLITIKWRTREMSVCSTHVAELTPDNWYVITMWKFIHHGPNSGFDITLEELSYHEKPSVSSLGLLIQGIEFQPTDMNEDIDGVKSLSITDEEDKDNDDAYWEKKLPNDYHRYIDMSEKPMDYITKKDLYHGFLGDNGQLWFSLCKTTGKLCSMLRAIDIVHHVDDYKGFLHSLSLPESRFGKVIQLQDAEWFRFEYRLRSPMFSPYYIYACYLVFKFKDDTQPNDTFLFKTECMLDDISQGAMFAYLISSPVNIPTIEAHSDYGLQGLKMPKGVVYSRIDERKDGWMEVMLCKPLPQLENDMSLTLYIWESKYAILNGMVLQGIEFRPCV